MAYDIKYRTGAKKDANYLRSTYGQNFSDELDRRLQLLAEAAEKKDDSQSIDGLEALSQLDEIPTDSSQWRYSLRKLRESDYPTRLRAIVVLLRKKCPPWEFRFSSHMMKLLDRISHEVQFYYEIDHVDRRVIFTVIELGNSSSFADDEWT